MDTQLQDRTVSAAIERSRYAFRQPLLAIALAVGALLASSTTAGAQQPTSADPGVRCAAKIGVGEYEFYLPGAKVTDKDGNKWVCGPDGQWFRDYSAMTGTTPMPPVRPRVPTTYLAPPVTAIAILR